MQYSPQQIKDKLLRALDDDNNVVDMAQVLEVISILEVYAITREALEQTRIGKTVNDMRKKTKNEELAKRAKRLVRKWQTLVHASGSGDSATTNGDQGGQLQHPSVSMLQGSPRSRPNSPASIHSNISPGLPLSRPGTPLTPGNRSSLNRVQARPLTPNIAGGAVSRSQTNASPKPYITGRPGLKANPNSAPEVKSGRGQLVSPSVCSGGSDRGRLKPPIVNHSNGNKSSSPALCRDPARPEGKKRPRTEINTDNSSTKRLSVREHTKTSETPTSSHKLAIKCQKMSSPVNGRVKHDVKLSSGKMKGFIRESQKGEVINKSATISPSLSHSRENSRDSDTFSAKRNINFSIQPKNGPSSEEKLVKPPKARVKTTAQIIADMQAKSDTVDNELVKRIACVEREADDVNMSIVPAGALPRARRKPHEAIPQLTPNSRGRGKLSPNKTELVEKFLLSSVATPSPVEDYTAFKEDDARLNSETKSSAKSETSLAAAVAGPSESGRKSELIDPLSLLPPLNLDEIVWNEEEGYEVVEREMLDTDLNRISSDNWEGVNGCLDGIGNWRDWAQTFSTHTYDGELLHILPYVNIDD